MDVRITWTYDSFPFPFLYGNGKCLIWILFFNQMLNCNNIFNLEC